MYGIPDRSVFEPNPTISTPYKRPMGTTTAQRANAQGTPCVVCGSIGKTQVADHHDGLAVEYYRTGTNDIAQQSSTSATQTHCMTCSSKQGGKAAAFSNEMNKKLGIKK